MQGALEGNGQNVAANGMPAHESKKFYRRYSQSLLAISVPALMAGLIAGWMVDDSVKPGMVPISDLAQRVENIRIAESKLDYVDPAIRTSALHVPLSDVSEVVQ